MNLFDTKHLQVRYLEKSDREFFYNMQSNPNVMRYIKNTMNEEQSWQELNRFIGYYTNTSITYNIWAIVKKEDQQFVGICGVYKNEMNEYEIAYRLRECFWGQGLGKEIAKGVIAYCFHEMKIPVLTAYVHKNNIGSVSILEKEMNFIEESFSEKENTVERKYKAYLKDFIEES